MLGLEYAFAVTQVQWTANSINSIKQTITTAVWKLTPIPSFALVVAGEVTLTPSCSCRILLNFPA